MAMKHYLTFTFLLIFLFLNTVLYIGFVPLFHEEPRRAIIAQEMLITGNYMIPTVYQEPYIKKPPMQNWMIALTSVMDKTVSNFDTRLPSIISYLLLILIIFNFLRINGDVFAFKAALIAATSYVILFSYSYVAEPDMLLTFLTFAAYILFITNPFKLEYIVFSSLLMGLGILTKGTSPLFFYPGIIVYAIFFSEKKLKFIRNIGLHLLISATIPLAWLLLYHFSGGDVSNIYGGFYSEAAGRAKGSIKEIATHILIFPFRVFCALFPWSLVIFFAFKKNVGFKKDPVYISSFIIFLISFLIMAVLPAGKGRYFMPAVPFFAVIAAYHIDEVKLMDIRVRGVILICFSIVFIAGIFYFLFQGIYLQPIIFFIALAGVYMHYKSGQRSIFADTLILILFFAVGYFNGFYFNKSLYYTNYEEKALEIKTHLDKPDYPIVLDNDINPIKLAVNLERTTAKVIFRRNIANFKNYYLLTNQEEMGNCLLIHKTDFSRNYDFTLYLFECNE